MMSLKRPNIMNRLKKLTILILPILLIYSKKLTMAQKLVKLKKIITDRDNPKSITTQRFNKLTQKILLQD